MRLTSYFFSLRWLLYTPSGYIAREIFSILKFLYTAMNDGCTMTHSCTGHVSLAHCIFYLAETFLHTKRTCRFFNPQILLLFIPYYCGVHKSFDSDFSAIDSYSGNVKFAGSISYLSRYCVFTFSFKYIFYITFCIIN